MMVYPNPVDGNYVTILSPVEGLKEIQVFTVTGRKVMDTAINGNTLDVSSFNSGFYMLKVTINGQSKVSKLVISSFVSTNDSGGSPLAVGKYLSTLGSITCLSSPKI